MTMAEELAAKGTHFHQGEVVVYSLAAGCPFQYTDAIYCPSCGGAHKCGTGCAA